ncbi:MAG: DUF309 domain-containing protein [Nitratireductor sp.]
MAWQSGAEMPAPGADDIAASLPMPNLAHLPGINARSEDEVLEQAKTLAPSQTRSWDWRENVAWLYGIRLIREGFYWEAHEVLETVWMNAAPNSREKALVQALIHGANARLKQRLGRPNAAARLVALSTEACKQVYEKDGGPVLGLSTETAMAFCSQIRDESDESGPGLSLGDM